MRVTSAGNIATSTAAIDSTPSGWRHPNDPPATSLENDDTAHAAASDKPRATGTSSMPMSGTRTGRASRSWSTASVTNTTTRPAERAAHVRRHARASNSPVITGT